MSEVYKDLELSLKDRTDKEQEDFNRLIESKYKNMTPEEIEASIQDVGSRVDELKSLVGLGDVTKIVSITYIAETYFNKSRSWLGHRINGNIINGKPARFSPDELVTLKRALEDISDKMREASAKIALV